MRNLERECSIIERNSRDIILRYGAGIEEERTRGTTHLSFPQLLRSRRRGTEKEGELMPIPGLKSR
jgi:hypothetical protein